MPQEKIKTKNKVVLSWIAPEYTSHKKSARWYIIAGIGLILLLIWAAFSKSWSMAIAVIVFAGVYQYTHTYHPPKNIKITVSEMGIGVGNLFFPYNHIKAFWIIYKPGLKTLNLHIAKGFFSDVIIQLNGQDPLPLRKYLVGQIAEWEGRDERLGDMILRLLKL